MATVGAVWINVLPSMQGFATNLQRQATSAAQVAGARTGVAMGATMADSTVGAMAKRMTANSRRMQATFVGSTNVMSRAIANFSAGFRSADAAASAFTGRMGRLGGVTRQAVTPGVNAVGRFAGGFRDAQVAASAFSGRLGTLGGVAGRALMPAVQAVGRFRDGFTNSQVAASAFSGRLGTLGGVARTALQPGINAARSIGTSMVSAGGVAAGALGRIRTGASTAFGAVRTGFSNLRANAAQSAETTGGVGSALTRMGAVGAAAVSAIGLGALGSSALSVASDIQQASASMAGLYGSTQLADDMMRRLRDYSRSTPLETQSLYEAGSNLAYLGLQGNDAMGVIQNVGTALMASGNTSQQAMGNVTNALLSMQSAGQLYAADIQRVSNEMVPAWDLLASHMGMSIKDVRAEVTAGNLTVDDFVAALQAGDGDYFEMMRGSAEQTNQTFRAQFAMVKDNVLQTLGETLLPLVDRAAPAMGRLGSSVEGGLRALPGIMSGVASAVRGAGLVEGFRNLVQGAREFGAAAMPAITAFGQVLGGAFLGALQVMSPVGDLLKSMAGWMGENVGVVKLLGAVLGGLVIGLMAVRAATMAWAVVQAVLNASLWSNPIGLIVIAIAALVAGVIYAYKNFDGFRKVVDTVAGAIKTAALWIWDNGLKPAFEGIKTAVSAVGNAAMWLWTNAIKPAWDAISAAARFLFTAVVVALLLPIVVTFKIVAAAAMWLWTNAIKPAWDAIAAGAVWLWNNALKPAWDGIKLGLQLLGAAFRWLWTNVINPVWTWISTKIKVWWAANKIIFQAVVNFLRATLGPVFRWLYNNVIQPVWNGIRTAIRVAWNIIRGIWSAIRSYILGPLASIFRWLWNNVIRPVWNGIRNTINSVWQNGIKPAFEKVKDGVRAMQRAFNRGREAIAKAWRGIRDAAKKPVNFLIGTVYNDGIRVLWNKVAGIVGADKIGKVDKFDRGGVMPGYTPGRDVHQFVSPTGGRLALSGGEAIMRPEFTRAVGTDYVSAMNQVARTSGVRGVRDEMGMSFARGGVFPDSPPIPSGKSMLDALKKLTSTDSLLDLGGDLITGDIKKALDKFFKPARDVTKQIGTTGLPGVPYNVVVEGGKKIKSKMKELIDAWNASFGGGGANEWVGLASASERLRRAAKWARTQHGKPYQWGGGGNPSWDCSGFIAGIENVIRGIRPGRRYTTHSFGGSPPPGWVRGLKSPFTTGVQHGGRGGGHMAGTLMGVNVESGGRGVQVGSGARGTGSFPNKFGFKPVAGDKTAGSRDSGGWLYPGTSLLMNGTGKPEPVLTQAQWRDMHELAQTVGREENALMRDAHVHLHESEATVRQAFRGIDLELRKRRRGGVHAGRGA